MRGPRVEDKRFMRLLSCLSCVLLALSTVVGQAAPRQEQYTAPQPGRYTAILTVTQTLLGVPVLTTVRAVAVVNDSGNLSIVMLSQPSVFPDVRPESCSIEIAPDGGCVIPQVAPVILPDGMIPIYRGQTLVAGSGFTLSYDSVPDAYTDVNGRPINIVNAVAPIPNARFTFTFRRTK